MHAGLTMIPVRNSCNGHYYYAINIQSIILQLEEVKLPKELDHPRKGLINIQKTDYNECSIQCLVRYLNPADYNPRRITKADKHFAKKLDFKDIKFPAKIRDTHKIENKNSIGISVFGYENKEKHPIHVSKKYCEEKHVELILMGEGEKKTLCSSQ